MYYRLFFRKFSVLEDYLERQLLSGGFVNRPVYDSTVLCLKPVFYKEIRDGKDNPVILYRFKFKSGEPVVQGLFGNLLFEDVYYLARHNYLHETETVTPKQTKKKKKEPQMISLK